MARTPRLYDGRAWRDRVAPDVLADEPICRICAALGIHTPAAVVDHVIPVRDRPDLAFDRTNLQPLCKHHHDSAKQCQERNGYHSVVDADGYPIDASHPANQGGVASFSASKDDRRGTSSLAKPAAKWAADGS